MAGVLRRLIRRLGYDFSRYPPKTSPWPKLVRLLRDHGATLVLDVGANTGQYAARLIEHGYAGRIVSYEPQAAAHRELTGAAGRHSCWEVAPRSAVGAAPGSTAINISAESDMSSILPMTEESSRHFASSRIVGRETVPVVTLGDEIVRRAQAEDRIFVKSDTQGYEPQVLDGLGGAVSRVVGLQLELALHPIYAGQPRYLPMLERIEAAGFEPYLIIPGYWSRHHGRMLEIDVVAFRRNRQGG